MVEHNLDLGVEQLGWVRVGWEVGVEHVADLDANRCHRGRLVPPVEHQLVVDVGEQPSGAGLHRCPLGVVEHRLGLGEQIEDRQLLLGHVLNDRPVLLVAQVP